MNREQAIIKFWRSFGLAAYDVGSVPEDAPFPRLTYNVAVDSFGNPVFGEMSLWYRSSVWEAIMEKSHEIEQAIGRGGICLSYDGGCVWLTRGTPWAQRVTDEDDTLRRISHNVTYEFID